MKPYRESKYLQWIRTLPCVVCRTARNVEAAHTGPHGLGQKSPDSSAIPLCISHHRTANDSYHKLGPRKFAYIHQVDIAAIVSDLNSKPRIKVTAGAFVGNFKEVDYVLGPTEAGLCHAVRKMIALGRMIQRDLAENR